MKHLLKHRKLYICAVTLTYILIFSLAVCFGGIWDTEYTQDINQERREAGLEMDYGFGSPEWYLKSIMDHSTNIEATSISDKLDEYKPEIYNMVTNVCDTVCKPFGYVILTLFALLEMLNIITARDPLKGEAIVYSFIRLAIRIIIAKVIVDNSKTLLLAIFTLVLKVIIKAQTTQEIQIAISSADGFFAELGNLGTFERLSASAVLLLAWVCVVGASILCKVIIAGRFIAIYLLIAVSPIPLAFFANEGQSEIAKSFLKRFAAECLQGLLIYLVLTFFPHIFETPDTAVGMSDWLVKCVINSLVLIVTVKSTSSLAKGIVNVM